MRRHVAKSGLNTWEKGKACPQQDSLARRVARRSTGRARYRSHKLTISKYGSCQIEAGFTLPASRLWRGVIAVRDTTPRDSPLGPMARRFRTFLYQENRSRRSLRRDGISPRTPTRKCFPRADVWPLRPLARAQCSSQGPLHRSESREDNLCAVGTHHATTSSSGRCGCWLHFHCGLKVRRRIFPHGATDRLWPATAARWNEQAFWLRRRTCDRIHRNPRPGQTTFRSLSRAYRAIA